MLYTRMDCTFKEGKNVRTKIYAWKRWNAKGNAKK